MPYIAITGGSAGTNDTALLQNALDAVDAGGGGAWLMSPTARTR